MNIWLVDKRFILGERLWIYWI